jgi:signal peptidase I
MKKIGIGFLIISGVIVLLLLTARLTGILLLYTVPTGSSEPTIKKGTLIFVSGISKPAPYKFIAFKNPYQDSVLSSYQPDYTSGYSFISRLCGAPGDFIEMKNGVLFVNNKNFDEFLDLKNQYKISTNDFGLIEEADFPSEESYEFIQTGDSPIVTFDNALYKKYSSKIKLKPYLITDTNMSGDCFKWYNGSVKWMPDNFGPLIIPANNYFVLGDNRHNAMDSRYTGFVEKENITGIVINK